MGVIVNDPHSIVKVLGFIAVKAKQLIFTALQIWASSRNDGDSLYNPEFMFFCLFSLSDQE